MAERNVNATITIRLNFSNYNVWKNIVETYLRQKALFKHLEYGSFELHRAANYIYTSIKEKRYFTLKQIILDTPLQLNAALPNRLSEEDKEQLLEDHETLFKDDFKSFESDRRKALEKWELEEEQIYGILSGCIDENIWQDARCLKSSKAIWDHLKRATGQQTTSTWLSTLNNFYQEKMKEGESLSNFASRVIKNNYLVADVGDDDIIFKPLHVIAKIISSIPNIFKYSNMLQSIHQIEKEKLTLECLKDIFIEEDKRIELAPKVPFVPKIKDQANSLKDKKPNPKSDAKKPKPNQTPKEAKARERK